MFRAGQLHITNSMPIARIDHYRENQPDHLWSVPEGRNVFLSFNPTRKPFTDSRVRRALSIALDRESLAENVMRKTWIPAYNIVPSGLGGFTGMVWLQESSFNATFQRQGNCLQMLDTRMERAFPRCRLFFPIAKITPFGWRPSKNCGDAN